MVEEYIIEGGNKLEGEVNVSGSKNAALPIIAASLLNKEVVTVDNCPDIHDVKIMLSILEELGCDTLRDGNKIIIDASKIKKCEIPENLMREMRSSVIIAGALIGRKKECVFSYPGGCEIGARPINMHLDGFKQLGVEIVEEHGHIKCRCEDLIGTDITLDFPSVGATENIMLASALAKGITHIRNVAREPEIKDLQDFLNEMGAKVHGAGSNTIVIEGVAELHSAKHKVIPDRIEAGTYLCMVAGNNGRVILNNVIPEHVSSVMHKLKQVGCKIDAKGNKIFMQAPLKIISTNIKTMPYPGFPTDMQSQFTALLSVASGTSIIIENIFENRYKYVNELVRMGANITIEGRTAVIQGVTGLRGAILETRDLRGGAALVLASLMAEGESRISGVNFLERGYEDLTQKLTQLGAKIYKK